MPRKKDSKAVHTGRTEAGNTRDFKVERVGKVTIYRRGETYHLYYRQGGVTHRRKVDGNLTTARATAHKVVAAMDESRPSPIAFNRTSPADMVAGYLRTVADVQKLALRTQDRYRAALDRFLDFCTTKHINLIDTIAEATVEDFVQWLRSQKRTRNGATKGKRAAYQVSGVKFILSTCRTAFNWATRHRMLPPFTPNPFIQFGIDKLRDRTEEIEKDKIFTPAQERDFFNASNTWQRDIFGVLAGYGLRVGELTHLLVDDVDLTNDTFVIRSKPWLFWSVKTGRERHLPLLPATRDIFTRAIGDRKAGFVFLHPEFRGEPVRLPQAIGTPAGFKASVERVVADLLHQKPGAGEREQKRAAVAFCRTMGQIPERRIRSEFMDLTTKIGTPDFTRVHDLRHLFSSRAQEAGINPILVQEMLGHTTLEMTRKYTHLGMDSKREALNRLNNSIPVASRREESHDTAS